MTTPDAPTLLSLIEPVAWRYRGPKGGWITVETMPPHSYVGVQALYPEAALTRLQSALEARTEECAKVAIKIGTKPMSECENLGPMDPETGISECRHEAHGDCLCAAHLETGEDTAAAIRKLQEQS